MKKLIKISLITLALASGLTACSSNHAPDNNKGTDSATSNQADPDNTSGARNHDTLQTDSGHRDTMQTNK